jgi:hypothetical protein
MRLTSYLAASYLVSDEGESAWPIILDSAHRHGVSEEDMLHALRFAIHHVRQDDSMVMFVGPDRSGLLIEVGVVMWWGGELAIAHAMKPARTKYLR